MSREPRPADPRLKCANCGILYTLADLKPCPYPGGPEGMNEEGRRYLRCTFDLMRPAEARPRERAQAALDRYDRFSETAGRRNGIAADHSSIPELTDALRALLAEAHQREQELEDWKVNKMADHTGHMFRCAKVNGVWSCRDGCAVHERDAARAALGRLREYMKHRGNCSALACVCYFGVKVHHMNMNCERFTPRPCTCGLNELLAGVADPGPRRQRGAEMTVRERALSIAPMITDLADEVLALRCKYQHGESIDHAVGEVRNALDNLEDAMEKSRDAQGDR